MKLLIKNKIITSFKISKRKFIINKNYKILILILFIMSGSLFFIKPINRALNKAKKNENYVINTLAIEQNFYNYYKSLKSVSFENISLVDKYRNRLLKIFSRYSHKNVTEVDNIYINEEGKFGNQLIIFNKVFFYCEILKCKKIILRRNNNIYIRKTIVDKKFNITIELAKKGVNYTNELITNYIPQPYYDFYGIKPENKFYIFRDEILRNLPYVKINKNDLYIHIRSGDIFINTIVYSYSQPPYCFYKAVINNNLFDKIHIISEDKRNPVINKLLKRFPNIIFKKNSLELDISYLARAYNIVGSMSSFFTEIIKININLKKLYEYNNYNLKEKIYHLHHLLYNYKRNYSIYLMESSKNYKKYMYIWKLTKKQIKIMLNDKCPKKFEILNPN